MQKSQLDSAYIILLQATYHHVELGVARIENSVKHIIDTRVIPKHDAACELILVIQQLLCDHGINFADIGYLVVNRGPAPFTTLRVVLSTAQALAYTHHIPMIGIDALHTLANTAPNTIVLLNAFHHDLYWAIANNGETYSGWCHRDQLAEIIQKYCVKNSTYTMVGNAAATYVALLHELTIPHAYPHIVPEYLSLEQLAQTMNSNAAEYVAAGNIIQPLYLKTEQYKNSIKIG